MPQVLLILQHEKNPFLGWAGKMDQWVGHLLASSTRTSGVQILRTHLKAGRCGGLEQGTPQYISQEKYGGGSKLSVSSLDTPMLRYSHMHNTYT